MKKRESFLFLVLIAIVGLGITIPVLFYDFMSNTNIKPQTGITITDDIPKDPVTIGKEETTNDDEPVYANKEEQSFANSQLTLNVGGRNKEYPIEHTNNKLTELYLLYEQREYDKIIKDVKKLTEKYKFEKGDNRLIAGIYSDAQFALGYEKIIDNDELADNIAMSVTPRALFYNVVYSKPFVSSKIIKDPTSAVIWLEKENAVVNKATLITKENVNESGNQEVAEEVELLGTEIRSVVRYDFTALNERNLYSFIAQKYDGECIFIGTYGDTDGLPTVEEIKL